MKSVVLTCFLCLCAVADNTYYPTDFQNGLKSGSLKEERLRDQLFKILSMKHIYRKGQNDEVVPHCGQSKGRCYGHKVLGYYTARKILFGKLHLEEGKRGYYVSDVYCRINFDNSMTRVGPNIIPNHTKLNCEHTWPQSRFSKRFPKEMQKSDLHHLYPTQSKANGVRGNYPFSDTNSSGERVKDCGASRVGSYGGSTTFEPPTEHKGNVARALFYFSVRYRIPISDHQEEALKRWNELDPVDADEMERNEMIARIQGNRNPFVDYAHLSDLISDF